MRNFSLFEFLNPYLNVFIRPQAGGGWWDWRSCDLKLSFYLTKTHCSFPNVGFIQIIGHVNKSAHMCATPKRYFNTVSLRSQCSISIVIVYLSNVLNDQPVCFTEVILKHKNYFLRKKNTFEHIVVINSKKIVRKRHLETVKMTMTMCQKHLQTLICETWWLLIQQTGQQVSQYWSIADEPLNRAIS